MKQAITVLAVPVLLAVGFAVGHMTYQLPEPPPPAPTKPALPDSHTLWQLSNEERRKAGVPLLNRSPSLDASAAAKCADMQAKGYWAHVSPDGTEPFEIIKQYTSYRSAGENLAQDTGDAASTTAAWMASPDHKASIVEPKFTAVGYATCDGAMGVLTVQHFAQQ
jgi:uncharacterized protein YkwD